MKDPDALHEALLYLIEREVKSIATDEDEIEMIVESRLEREKEKFKKWFSYDEYLSVEFDTDSMTATVIRNK